MDRILNGIRVLQQPLVILEGQNLTVKPKIITIAVEVLYLVLITSLDTAGRVDKFRKRYGVKPAATEEA